MSFVQKTNLNLLSIPTDCADQPIAELRNPTSAETIAAHFQDLESELVKFVSSYPVVVGCVAWLTNFPVLAALADRKVVSVLVQKEDFLRSDSGEWSKNRLRGPTAHATLLRVSSGMAGQSSLPFVLSPLYRPAAHIPTPLRAPWDAEHASAATIAETLGIPGISTWPGSEIQHRVPHSMRRSSR